MFFGRRYWGRESPVSSPPFRFRLMPTTSLFGTTGSEAASRGSNATSRPSLYWMTARRSLGSSRPTRRTTWSRTTTTSRFSIRTRGTAGSGFRDRRSPPPRRLASGRPHSQPRFCDMILTTPTGSRFSRAIPPVASPTSLSRTSTRSRQRRRDRLPIPPSGRRDVGHRGMFLQSCQSHGYHDFPRPGILRVRARWMPSGPLQIRVFTVVQPPDDVQTAYSPDAGARGPATRSAGFRGGKRVRLRRVPSTGAHRRRCRRRPPHRDEVVEHSPPRRSAGDPFAGSRLRDGASRRRGVLADSGGCGLRAIVRTRTRSRGCSRSRQQHRLRAPRGRCGSDRGGSSTRSSVATGRSGT